MGRKGDGFCGQLMPESNLIERARALDAEDALSGFRGRFRLPVNRIYLDGNSLGLLSREAESALEKVVTDWRELGVDGWLDGRPPWFTLAEQAAELMAPLMGSSVEETAVGCSTTVNLHQLLSTLYVPEGGRTRILIDANAFPSDRYAVASHLNLRGRNPEEDTVIVPTTDGFRLDEERIIESFDETVSLVLLPGVVYTTGQLLNMPRLTEAAHRAGCVIGFDCSHSAGAIPHALSAWGVDFAFWCGYKYLNGGPGAAAGLYLNRRHFRRGPGLAGWFSSELRRF
jgi:kynureninase